MHNLVDFPATDLGILSSSQLWAPKSAESLSPQATLAEKSCTATIRVPSRGITIWLSVPGDPSWFETFRNACGRILNLEANWDSYGAKSISISAVRHALYFLARVAGESYPVPHIVPTSAGGIQVEWHKSKIDFEIEFAANGSIHVYYCDEETGESWERDFQNLDLEALKLPVEALRERVGEPAS